jgi:hypothetical protein
MLLGGLVSRGVSLAPGAMVRLRRLGGLLSRGSGSIGERVEGGWLSIERV